MRSSAASHVPCRTCSSIPKRARRSPSSPQWTPASTAHCRRRSTSSSEKRNRRRTGPLAARSSTSDAVTRPSARRSSVASSASTGLVVPAPRSARLTRSRWPGCASSPSSGTAPKVAVTSGANVSTSGHSTMTSRAWSVGSAENRPTSVSRSTSTCRARPWHASTCTERSVGSSAWVPSGASARSADCSAPSRVGGGGAASWWVSRASPAASRSCSSTVSRPVDARNGWRANVGRSARRQTGAPAWSALALAPPVKGSPADAATVAHSAGEGCTSHRWTSRCSASARRTRSLSSGSRVGPNTDSRGGRSTAAGSACSAATASVTRRAGSVAGTRSTRRRHSSGCHARSSGATAVPVTGADHASTTSGRWRA